MLPITGPFRKDKASQTVYYIPGYGDYSKDTRAESRVWYRQKKPYNLHLQFDYYLDTMDGLTYPFSYAISQALLPPDVYLDYAYNKAYAKFIDKAKDNANWAVNFAERRQSLRNLTERSMQIFRFANKLRKLDFFGAAKELKLAVVPKGVSAKKAFGNNYLEYHFGWEPLVKDIGTTIDLLQKPYPKGMRVSGKGQEPYRTDGTFGIGGSNTERRLLLSSNVARIDATISVSNPNLFLANQMGFINPFVVAWELVPFSFVVDWFTNVGQILASSSDLCGLDIISSSNTRHMVAKSARTASYVGAYSTSASFVNVRTVRRPGIGSGPTLVLRPIKPISFTRAATAISLLLQRLR